MEQTNQKKELTKKVDRDLTEEEFLEILLKNRALRRKRQKKRKQRKTTPLDNISPRLVLSTFADPEGTRLPGTELSLASDISIQDQKINIMVYNYGSLPSFGTIVEFIANSRTVPIDANVPVSWRKLVFIPSIPPYQKIGVTCPEALPSDPKEAKIVVQTWSVLDPLLKPYDWGDRHVAYFNVGWLTKPAHYGNLVTFTSPNPELHGKKIFILVAFQEISRLTYRILIKMFWTEEHPQPYATLFIPYYYPFIDPYYSVFQFPFEITTHSDKIKYDDNNVGAGLKKVLWEIKYIDMQKIKITILVQDLDGQLDYELSGVLNAYLPFD
ncbi:MAG: hypothetical protein ACFFHV_22445 [Promethearchaeota archaeon]